MADRIRINTDRLGADAERIQGFIKQIVTEMNEIKQSAAALETMWEGMGREAFHKAFWDDMGAIETVIEYLEDIYRYDTNAKKQYEQCDRKVASMIADIRV